ncbi:lys-63-specific deubiquitinase BRCC36-like [Oscarella lobularis]|uniref:lys-63-specific deubiquitinase BRCC36-like n=1 Tax=Oscarella lobularis TaxID=121494 RepID=UPI003313E6B7
MVKGVKVELDAFCVCLTHSLSTEEEEVMGLLIGEIIDDHAIVSTVSMLRRSDKRKDRVEISPEQLARGAQEAERMAEISRRPMRVLGWYHSHPHITVWPSHVDTRTQAMYQNMDPDFIGLIFSCFNSDPQNFSRIELTCFQSKLTPAAIEGQEIPDAIHLPVQICRKASISQFCLEALNKLPLILLEEEQEAYKEAESDNILSQIHNGAVFVRSLSRFMEIICAPAVQMLESRLEQTQTKVKRLQAEKRRLQEALDS